ncbi:hypothetical protein JAO29_21405 [Edaphobacter sp. HDX4]|jgi:hypothetical protein
MDPVIHFLSEILVPLFFVGIGGSLLVVVFTVIQDVQQIFKSDEEEED